MNKYLISVSGVAMALVLSSTVLGAVTNFTSGTPISSTDVNNNFKNLNGNLTDGPCVTNNASDEMVRVGPICVDKYEASLWPDKTNAGTTPTLANTCLADGSDCTYVAQSRVNVAPTGGVSWLQATQACANAGKRLLTPGEWFMAAVGTNPANCNLSAPVDNTGSNPTCASRHAVVDMIGNLSEFIDHVQANSTGAGVDGFPHAGYTGGQYDSTGATLVNKYFANFLVSQIDARVGFRCAR